MDVFYKKGAEITLRTDANKKHCIAMHYVKVVKTRFEVVNFDKSILHQFSTKMSQIFNDGVKRSNFLKNVIRFPNIMDKSSENSKKPVGGVVTR